MALERRSIQREVKETDPELSFGAFLAVCFAVLVFFFLFLCASTSDFYTFVI